MFSTHLILFIPLFALAFASGLPEAGPPSYSFNPIHGPVPRQSTCPTVWKEIAAELKQTFSGCNNAGRSAVRFAFHDAAGFSSLTKPYGPATGGADGSLLLNDVEVARSDNDPMQVLRNNLLLPMYNKYKSRGVGAADLVQLAGSVGTRSCPGGPLYKTVRLMMSVRSPSQLID